MATTAVKEKERELTGKTVGDGVLGADRARCEQRGKHQFDSSARDNINDDNNSENDDHNHASPDDAAAYNRIDGRQSKTKLQQQQQRQQQRSIPRAESGGVEHDDDSEGRNAELDEGDDRENEEYHVGTVMDIQRVINQNMTMPGNLPHQYLPVLPMALQLDGIQHHTQLIITYQGETWTFENVPQSKVEMVLHILRSNDVVSDANDMDEMNARLSNAEVSNKTISAMRQEKLNRFIEKRKRRQEGLGLDTSKKVRYAVRQEVAQNMRRVKGQFANKRTNDEIVFKQCVHCGTSDTPLMRKGPDGHRSLCNACGLVWANQGVLRKLKKGRVKDEVNK